VAAFLDRLAAGTPTPGGGSAAALAGALGGALLQMVCRLTVGRDEARPHEAALGALLGQAADLEKHLRDLVDEDALAYDQVMAALRLPKGTDEEKAARRAALRRANATATDTPLRTAEACHALLGLAAELAATGNRNALSDIGSAAQLAQAGLRGAVMNVRINLPGLGDPQQAGQFETRVGQLEEEGSRRLVLCLERLAERTR
ncbi:MAG TPA: cyclodeaminase/cyclohydrolase family protein, partial [Candidatus Polarisedimenticolia bacterium]|nr:cyclodeaminase/cyclohydrolase family protein [Candidatus Polarisedimenticolia bacterium]